MGWKRQKCGQSKLRSAAFRDYYYYYYYYNYYYYYYYYDGWEQL